MCNISQLASASFNYSTADLRIHEASELSMLHKAHQNPSVSDVLPTETNDRHSQGKELSIFPNTSSSPTTTQS